MTPEEKALIAQALRWSRGWVNDHTLMLAVQALKISRQPMQGPDPIPCMARASHSATMFCVLPKAHKDSEPDTWHGQWGYSYHQGVAANGSRRRFRVEHIRDQAVSTGQVP